MTTAQIIVTLEQIVQTTADIETLDTRYTDELDFHELSVWTLKAMLLAAYQAGQQSKTI